MMVRVLAPGEADQAAELILEAAALDDESLGTFLHAFAERVETSAEPVTAAELRALLDGVPSG